MFGVATLNDVAVFYEYGTSAKFANVFHRMSDKYHGLVFVFKGFEIIGTFLLESSVADGKDFVE